MVNFATHPENRRSLRAWKGERCPSTYKASETLNDYGLRHIANLTAPFNIVFLNEGAKTWEEVVYAFVINDEIVRIGSSKGNLEKRMRAWSNHVTKRMNGEKSSTTKTEAELWEEELKCFGGGTIWARKGTLFETPISKEQLRAYQDEESALIARHKPRLNRGQHR